MDTKAQIILESVLLAGTAYFFSIENGIRWGSSEAPTPKVRQILMAKGVLSRNGKLIDSSFGYACYEHYRQRYNPDSFDLLLQQEVGKHRKILDLCCGAGATIFSLLQYRPKLIYGIDSDEDQIKLLEALLQHAQIPNHSVITRSADAHHIPLDDAAVDLAICRAALQYLDAEQTVEELYRVLSPGGKVFLLVHGSGYSWDYLFTRKGILKPQTYSYVKSRLNRSRTDEPVFGRSQANYFTTRKLANMLEVKGFRDIQLHTFAESMRLGMLPVYFAMTALR
ncbi:class I SAM-dependent methyltransferase [Paenibacillus sinopodophylli]|uniref:class I SAM-dependent methyltransferase n=1 Tax=Paenibacillus sinopodophylli TaxID=1837342 RepID=UPI00110CF59D|nr:class I SAM-dependent methyltransferase [Paenibacillus sinopodophylli]